MKILKLGHNTPTSENEVKSIAGVYNTIYAFLNTVGGNLFYALNTPDTPYNVNKYGEIKNKILSYLTNHLGHSNVNKYISFKEDDVIIDGILYLIIKVKRSDSIISFRDKYFMRVGKENKVVRVTKDDGTMDETAIKEIISYNRWVQNGDFDEIKDYVPDDNTARIAFNRVLKDNKLKFKQIGSLGGGNYFYKYLNINTFLTCLKNGNLRFAEPVEWNDKYEARFYNADYDILKANKDYYPYLYANCVTNRPDSEAAWQVYRYGKTGPMTCCVEIQINRFKFREQLAKNLSDCDIFVGMTKYEHKAIIDCLHYKKYPHDIIIKGIRYCKGDENLEFVKYFNEFCREKYLNLMLLKRMAFEYEHEVRFFIIPHNKTADDKTKLDTLDKNKKKGLTQKFVKIDWVDVVESVRIDSDCSTDEKNMVQDKLYELVDNSSLPLLEKEELKKKLIVEEFNVHGSADDARITIGEDSKLHKII